MRRIVALALGAVLALPFVAGIQAGAAASSPPKTGFEQRNGASWTTDKEELKVLAEVDAMSPRVEIDVIGHTKQKRPLHLVQLGHPAPRNPAAARRQPTILFVCSQHGNEPAGREACLKLLRDLAFTDDPALVDQLQTSTILFVPTANPDGRAANSRENSAGIDINRDHLTLETEEAQAIAQVVKEWQPDVSLDLHEYGPSVPALYDDEVLYLWPRNLNADAKVHDLAKHLGDDYVKKEAEENGYTADQYGQYALADQDIHQSAGDGDEGIMRNAMGLRHSLGVLVETAVTQDPRNGPHEVVDETAVNLRRVESHMVVSHATLHFLKEEGTTAMKTTADAARRKTLEGMKGSAPVYFDGADNQEPTVIQDPPPCAYSLTMKQFDQLRGTLSLLGINSRKAGKDILVPMGQPAEPLIPLLLDERGSRHVTAGKPLDDC